jgi:plastocyanin
VRSRARRGRVSRLLAAVLGLLSVAAGSLAEAGRLLVAVRLPDGSPLPGAVVTAFALAGANHPGSPVSAVVDQINLTFAPDLIVIPVGSKVDFPNSDSISHQVYSFSAARRFQLPLYRGKAHPPVSFDQPGIVTLGCNIHDDMLAHIVVTDALLFGRTDASGIWSVPDAPTGRYRIEVWHPRLRDTLPSPRRELVVGDSGRAELTVRLMKSLKPAPIEGRPHSWDAY